MFENYFKRILKTYNQYMVLLNYSEKNHEYLPFSFSRPSLTSRHHFLVSYSSLEQDHSKYTTSL